MLRCKHLHYLIPEESCTPLDVAATMLVLSCRGGCILAGNTQRRGRDALAELLGGDGVLAELLASERPIRVTSHSAAYVFEEL
jgi:hypothetical protein